MSVTIAQEKSQERGAPIQPPKESNRSPWIDQVRLLVILLVVNMHACVTYSHVGSWYTNIDPEPGTMVKLIFVLWQGHLQAFFMGLLFFVAGYFAEKARRRKGSGLFVVERLIRLGLPTLFFMSVVNPLTLLILKSAGENPNFSYLGYLTSGAFLSGTGPLWFAEALLIFSVIYSMVPMGSPQPSSVRITGLKVIGFAVGVALISFLVRMYQPIGSSFFNLQFCFFSQYVAVFTLGIWLAKRRPLADLAAMPLARKAGLIAIVLGPLSLIASYLIGGPVIDQTHNPYFGGFHIQSLMTCLWEQLSGFGLGLGVLSLTLRKMNNPGKLASWMSQYSFGVYVLHTPVLVAGAILLKPITLPPLVMAPTLTIIGLLVTFPLAAILSRLPVLGRILA